MTKIKEIKNPGIPKGVTYGEFFKDDKYKNHPTRIESEKFYDKIKDNFKAVREQIKQHSNQLASTWSERESDKEAKRKPVMFLNDDLKKWIFSFNSSNIPKESDVYGKDFMDFYNAVSFIQQERNSDFNEEIFNNNLIYFFERELKEATYIDHLDLTFYNNVGLFIIFLKDKLKKKTEFKKLADLFTHKDKYDKSIKVLANYEWNEKCRNLLNKQNAFIGTNHSRRVFIIWIQVLKTFSFFKKVSFREEETYSKLLNNAFSNLNIKEDEFRRHRDKDENIINNLTPLLIPLEN